MRHETGLGAGRSQLDGRMAAQFVVMRRRRGGGRGGGRLGGVRGPDVACARGRATGATGDGCGTRVAVDGAVKIFRAGRGCLRRSAARCDARRGKAQSRALARDTGKSEVAMCGEGGSGMCCSMSAGVLRGGLGSLGLPREDTRQATRQGGYPGGLSCLVCGRQLAKTQPRALLCKTCRSDVRKRSDVRCMSDVGKCAVRAAEKGCMRHARMYTNEVRRIIKSEEFRKSALLLMQVCVVAGCCFVLLPGRIAR